MGSVLARRENKIKEDDDNFHFDTKRQRENERMKRETNQLHPLKMCALALWVLLLLLLLLFLFSECLVCVPACVCVSRIDWRTHADVAKRERAPEKEVHS